MPYIGRGSDFGVRSRFIYTATAGQTSFTGNDDAGILLAYTDTQYMDVYQNGVLLVPATDYAASTGTSVVLVQGASVDDTVELLVFDIFSVADSVSAKDGGTFSGSVSMGGTLAVTGAITSSSVAVKVAGKETIWIPAAAMQATDTNGCSALTTVETTSGRPDMVVLDFDKDSDEFAQFNVAFPKSWNEGTVTFQFFWSGIAATTGVTLGLQGVAVGDNDTIDVVYGTAVLVDDDAQGAVEEMLVSAESAAITIAGSPAVDQLCYFRMFRDVSATNDDMAGDCRLHGIKLFFTTDAANDA